MIIGKDVLDGEEVKEELERFREKNNVVVSAPGIFFIAGEHAVLSGAPALCIPIPYRVYVGLEAADNPFTSTEETSISFGIKKTLNWKSRKFEQRGSSFIEQEGRTGTEEKVRELLKRVVEEYNLKRKAFKINVLSTFPPGHGANWSGAFSAALAVGLLVFNEALEPHELTSWANTPIHLLFQNEAFKKCNHIAWQIENIFHGGRASGYGTALVLASARHGTPLLYLTQPRSDKDEKLPPITVEDPELLRNICFFAYEIADLFDEQRREKLAISSNGFPLRIFLVDTGEPKHTATTIQSVMTFEKKGLEGLEPLLGLLEKMPKGLSKEVENYVCDLSRVHKPYAFLTQLCIRAFSSFYQICSYIREGDRNKVEQHVLYFLETLRNLQAALEERGLDTWQMQSLKGAVYGKLLQKAWKRAAIKWTGAGGGGTAVVFLANLDHEDESNIDAFMNFCDRSQKFTLYWDSFKDKIETTGVKLEPSAFCPHRVSLITYTLKPGEERPKVAKVAHYEFTDAQLEKAKCEEGLFVDCIRNWIYLDGKKLNVPSHEALAKFVATALEIMSKTSIKQRFDDLIQQAQIWGIQKASLHKYIMSLKVNGKEMFCLEKWKRSGDVVRLEPVINTIRVLTRCEEGREKR